MTSASAAAPRLSELAALISEKAAYLERYLDDNNLPQPSFRANGPNTFPVEATAVEASAARFALIDAAKDLRDLVVGPRDTLRWLVLNVCSYTFLLLDSRELLLEKSMNGARQMNVVTDDCV